MKMIPPLSTLLKTRITDLLKSNTIAFQRKKQLFLITILKLLSPVKLLLIALFISTKMKPFQ